ncbi:MAG: PorT family protein [Chitinophagaceae bacterium]|nr:PorT family protein [Chitinophagaceae bacterium]
MKIILSICLILFSCFSSNAQLRLGIKAGYNNAWADYRNPDGLIKHNITAFQVGVLGEVKIRKMLLRTNILFNQKGNYVDNGQEILDAGRQSTYRINYLEGNILVGYKFSLGRVAGIAFAAGPFIAKGISGTEKGSGSSLAGVYLIDRKIKFSDTEQSDNSTAYLRPIDYGIDINVTANFKKLFLYVNYGKGLASRSTSSDYYANQKPRNSVLSAGLGFYFF